MILKINFYFYFKKNKESEIIHSEIFNFSIPVFPNVTGDRTEKIKINHIPNPITSGDSEGCFKVRETMTSISWQDMEKLKFPLFPNI